MHWKALVVLALGLEIGSIPAGGRDRGLRVRHHDPALIGARAAAPPRRNPDRNLGGVTMNSGILVALMTLALAVVAGAPARADTPLVVASFYPLYEFARQVAGNRAEVISLIPPGVEPHDWEPSPQDVVRVQKAKLFVYNGAGLEPWVDKLLRDAKAKGVVVVRASERVALITGESHEHGQEAKSGAKPKGDVHAVNPHVWLDPVRAQAQVEAIRAGFARIDPANAAAYAANAQAYRARLAALDAAFASGLKQCARRDIVTTHAAFSYVARRYGLTQIPISGLEPESEPSPADLAALVKQVKERKVQYVFFETLVSPKLAETLAREVGAKTLVLNPIEGLTKEEQAAGKNYVSLMEENLRNLRTALECK
jgi:zinc transport system substrate-binding protein